MRITSYSFGNVVIDEKKFSKDLIIINSEIMANWWRKKSHLLQAADLEKFWQDGIQTVIVGTGKFGLLRIDKTCIDFIQSRQIRLITERTPRAIEIYNSEPNKNNLLCALHLTC